MTLVVGCCFCLDPLSGDGERGSECECDWLLLPSAPLLMCWYGCGCCMPATPPLLHAAPTFEHNNCTHSRTRHTTSTAG